MDNDTVITPGIAPYPVEELQDETSILQDQEEQTVDSALAEAKYSPAWHVVLNKIEMDIKDAGDITQMADYSGDPSIVASLIGQAKFVRYLKDFKSFVEDAAGKDGDEQ